MKLKTVVFLLLLTCFSNVLFSQINSLQAGGATLPYPFYAKLFQEYYKKTGVKINYQPIGSGSGIQQLRGNRIDFAGSELTVSEDYINTYFSGEIIQIPMYATGIGVIFNLPEINTLKLDSTVIADIFLGNITKWNDKKIQKLNTDTKLPPLSITPIVRAEKSGTTSAFTHYLSRNSILWNKTIGNKSMIASAITLSAKGNKGVVNLAEKIKGSITYAGLAYIDSSSLGIASLLNNLNNFVYPSVEFVQKSVKNINSLANLKLNPQDSNKKNGYPIIAYTWILIYKQQQTSTIQELISWMVTDGKKIAKDYKFIPLQSKIQKQEISKINITKLHHD